jgi:hypothetical protein
MIAEHLNPGQQRMMRAAPSIALGIGAAQNPQEQIITDARNCKIDRQTFAVGARHLARRRG